MNIPAFTAESSLYRSRKSYRATAKSSASLPAQFGQAEGIIYPTLSISNIVKSSLGSSGLVGRSLHDFIYVGRVPPISVRGCCQQCLSSIPCADESCRRQRLGSCTRECGAEVIGGCECPEDRVVCTSLRADGECCKPGEVCTLD